MPASLRNYRLPALVAMVSASLAAQVTLQHPNLDFVSYGQPITFSATLATAGSQPNWVWRLAEGDPDGSLSTNAAGQALFDPPFVVSPQTFTLQVRAAQHPDQTASVSFVVQPHQALASVFPKVMGHKVDEPRVEFLAGHETKEGFVFGNGSQARFPRLTGMVSLAGHPDPMMAECWALASGARCVTLLTPGGEVRSLIAAGVMTRLCGRTGSPILMNPAVRYQGGPWELALFDHTGVSLFLMDAKGAFTTYPFNTIPVRASVYGLDGALYVAAGSGEDIFRFADGKAVPFATVENPFKDKGWKPGVTSLALDPSSGDLLVGVCWSGNTSGEAVFSIQRVSPKGKASHLAHLPSGAGALSMVACRGREIFVLDGFTHAIGKLDPATGSLSFVTERADYGTFTPGTLRTGAGASGAGTASIGPAGIAIGPDGRFRVWTNTCIGDLILPRESGREDKGDGKAQGGAENKGDSKNQNVSGTPAGAAGKATGAQEEAKG